MFYRSMKINAFANILCSLLILSSSASAATQLPQIPSGFVDETSEPTLLALPVNSRAVKQEMNTALSFLYVDPQYTVKSYKTADYEMKSFITGPEVQWPQQAFSEEKPLCKAMGSGCYLIEYSDPERLKSYPDLIPTADTNSELANDQQFFQEQILRHLPSLNNPLCEISAKPYMRKGLALAFDIPKEKKYAYSKYKKCIDVYKPTLRTPDVIKSQANDSFERAKKELSATRTLSAQTISDVLQHPYAFKDLPGLYKIALGNSSAQAAIENLMGSALWLTLEGLTSSAYSRLPTFPYRNDDSVTPRNFLTADAAFEKLTELKRVAPIISLTPAIRYKNSISCSPSKPCNHGLARQTQNGSWYTLAAYVPNRNFFYVDYSQDFYETVYSFQHEMWHAVTENSVPSQNFRDRVQVLVQLPENDQSDLALKQTIFYVTAQNEINAIHESDLLYRFAGDLTAQWGGKTPSAKAWYDADFSDIHHDDHQDHSRDFYIPRAWRMDGFNAQNPGRGKYEKFLNDDHGEPKVLAELSFFTILPFLYAVHKANKEEITHDENEKRWNQTRTEENTKFLSLISKVTSTLPPEVIELFSDRYRLTLPDFKAFEQPSSLPEIKFVKQVIPVRLTCPQASRIAHLMPGEWDHGIPFAFEITDGPCPIQDGMDPEHAGTHPAINAVPSLNALPCLNGGSKSL